METLPPVRFTPADAPRRRDGLELPAPQRFDDLVTVCDAASGRYFRVRGVEAVVLLLMDGSRSLAQVHVDTLRVFPAIRLSVEAVTAFAGRAASLGWLEGHAASAVGMKKRRWNPFRIALPIGSPEGLLQLLGPGVRWLYRGDVLAAVTTLLLVAAVQGYLHRPSAPPVVSSDWFLAWPAFAFVSVVHEFGHALTLRYYGGRSGAMGFMLLYGIPCFYCDLSDAWRLKSRRERVLVGLAGLGWQFALGAVALALLSLVQPGAPLAAFLWSVLGMCGLTALLNLNPLIRLDGYWILCDWLEMPNLRRRSFVYLFKEARARLRGTGTVAAAGRLPGRERWIYRTYGLAAGAYTLFMVAGMGRALVVGCRYLLRL